jgi:hypothetical protein
MAEPAFGAPEVARQSCGRSSDRPTTAPRAAIYGRSKHMGFLTEFNRAVLLPYLKSKSKLDLETMRDLSVALALGLKSGRTPAARCCGFASHPEFSMSCGQLATVRGPRSLFARAARSRVRRLARYFVKYRVERAGKRRARNPKPGKRNGRHRRAKGAKGVWQFG